MRLNIISGMHALATSNVILEAETSFSKCPGVVHTIHGH